MTDFFVSYAREDAAFAAALVADLEHHDWETWIDQSDIPPSVPWMKEIQRAIEEAMLVVVIESPDWLGSEPCRIELELAETARVPIVRVTPDLDRVHDAVLQIVAAHRALPEWRAVALQAASAAAIWSTADRKRSLLVRGRPLSVMRKALAQRPEDFSETATAFVRASRRASVRRWVLGGTVALIAPALTISISTSMQIAQKVNERVAQSVADATAAAERATYAQWNIYSALERSPTDVSDSFSRYYQLFDFLGERTPQQWDPVPVEATGPPTAASPDGTLTAAADGSQVVVADATGELTRLPASAKVSTLAWSPDGKWIAAATESGVDVISIRNAQTIPLRGGSGVPRSVTWLDAARVAVGGSAGTGTWQVFDGVPVVDLAGVRYGATVDTTLYTVDADGILTATDTGTGVSQPVAGENQTDDGTPSAMDASGSLLAVAYQGPTSSLRVIDTAGGDAADIPLPECSPIALSLAADGAAAYLVCNEASTNRTRVDLRSGVVTSQPLATQFVYGVRALDDRVLWGGSFGGVFETGLDLSGHRLVTAEAGCGAPIRKLVGAPDGHLLFQVGDATGSFACATNIALTSGGAEVHRLIFDASDGFAVPDAEVSPDGSLVAYGLSDGRVRVFNTEDYAPVYFAQVMPDQVRDVSFSPDGTTLIVAGAGGAIVALQLPFGSMAEGADVLVEDAVSRLQNAIDWGIYVRTVGED